MPAPVWLFIPTYNEAENIERAVRAALAELEGAAGPGRARILVVDDASPDGTGAIADRLAAELDGVEVLHRRGKDGLGAAYVAGYQAALAGGAERVIVMDADFSHDPADLPRLLAASETADLVLGSRYVPGGGVENWPLLRRVLSRGGGLYARVLLGSSVRDLTGGYRCVRREVLEAIDLATLRAQGYVFNIELTFRAQRAGFSVREIPIVFRDRERGQSKIGLSIAFEALKLIPRLRRSQHTPTPSAAARDPAAGTERVGSGRT